MLRRFNKLRPWLTRFFIGEYPKDHPVTMNELELARLKMKARQITRKTIMEDDNNVRVYRGMYSDWDFTQPLRPLVKPEPRKPDLKTISTPLITYEVFRHWFLNKPEGHESDN